MVVVVRWWFLATLAILAQLCVDMRLTPHARTHRLSGTMDHSQSLAKCFGKFKEGNCVTRIYTRYAVCSPSAKIVVICSGVGNELHFPRYKLKQKFVRGKRIIEVKICPREQDDQSESLFNLKESDGRTKRKIEVKVYSSRQDAQSKSLFKRIGWPNEKKNRGQSLF